MIDEYLDRGSPIIFRDLAEAAKHHLPGAAPATAAAPEAGAGAATAPELPNRATEEERPIDDLDDEGFLVALLRASRRPLTKNQLCRLHTRDGELRHRVELRHRSVPSGPDEPDGPSYDAPPRGCPVLA